MRSYTILGFALTVLALAWAPAARGTTLSTAMVGAGPGNDCWISNLSTTALSLTSGSIFDPSGTDGQQFAILLLSVARLWERAFQMGRVGALDSSSWEGIGKELTMVLATPGAQAYWKTSRHLFTPDFVAFVEEAVGSEGLPEKLAV